MEEMLDILIKLQQYDHEVKTTQNQIEIIPDQISALEKEIQDAEQRIREKNERLQSIKKEYKLKEGDIAINEEKITKLNSQTFAVKTNEEYRALLSEVDFLKKDNKRIEDDMIGLLEEEDLLKNTIGKFAEETNAMIGKKKEKIGNLQREKEKLTAELNVAQQNYNRHHEKLTPEVKALYNKITKVRGNAVCLINDETCTGCSSVLTPQLFNELKKRNNIILCDNCGRILVYVPHTLS